MSKFTKRVEKELASLQAFLKTLDDEKRKVAVTFVVANLLVDNFDLTKAVGMLERIKNMMMTTPLEKKDLERFLYIS